MGRAGEGRPFLAPVDPDVLLKFLGENEPTLAEWLTKLRADKPEQFKRLVPMLGHIYGPIMEQMKWDPTMAKMNMAKIKAQYQVRQARQTYEKAEAGSSAQGEAKQQLHDAAASLFDVILGQEKLRVERAASFLGEGGEANEPGPPPGVVGPIRERMHARAQAKGAAGPGPAARPRLEEIRKSVEAWEKNRDQIINTHVAELISETKPFPWMR